jgi:serine/threonine-protein kinase
MIGETLSHYEIIGKVGAGGMGEVYRARDPRLGREVAIKVLHPSFSQNAKRLARFEQEARAASALNHPNVLAIHDVGHEKGVPFLVTELLEGETLREKIESGSLTRRVAMEYAAQIAGGLAAAHGKNIVHRDLKPENVFITRDGHLKILDFGLAKLVEHDPDQPISTESPTEALTEAGAIVGTPGYMSPEQLHGEPADPRSDIFAFGVILYEMVSGRRPFSGSTAAEISASIMRDEPAPLSYAREPVSPTLDRVIRRCLEKNPADRFESAHDLAHMLRAVSDTGEVALIPPARLRNRIWLRPALVAVVVAAAAVASWWLLNLPKAPAIPEVKHIAVMPFEVEGDDPEARYLAIGLAELITDGLTIMERHTRGAAWVVPFDSDLKLRDARTEDNVTIGVRGVLDASSERMGLDLELVDAATGRRIDHRSIDEDARNLTALQQQPVQMVWEILGYDAPPAALEDLEDGLTNTLTACRAYLLGRGQLAVAEDEAGTRAAAASLEQAIEEDPTYFPARVALARAYSRLFEETQDNQWKERAIEQAEHAIGLDDSAFEPYVVLGLLYDINSEPELALEAFREAARRAGTAEPHMLHGLTAMQAGELEEAERALQTAINLRPDYYKSHHALGYVYYMMSRFDAAANEFRDAARAAPGNPEAHTNLGTVLYFLERREEATQAFEAALALGPYPTAYSNLGGLYFEDGRFGDAAEMFEEAVALEGEEIPAEHYYLPANLASAQYWSGDRDSAEANYELAIELAESFLEVEPTNYPVMSDLAAYYGMVDRNDRGIELLEIVIRQEIFDPNEMGSIAESYQDLGQPDRALEWLAKALENGLSVDWIDRRPSFNSLRADPRYREMVRRSSNRD